MRQHIFLLTAMMAFASQTASANDEAGLFSTSTKRNVVLIAGVGDGDETTSFHSSEIVDGNHKSRLIVTSDSTYTIVSGNERLGYRKLKDGTMIWTKWETPTFIFESDTITDINADNHRPIFMSGHYCLISRLKLEGSMESKIIDDDATIIDLDGDSIFGLTRKRHVLSARRIIFDEDGNPAFPESITMLRDTVDCWFADGSHTPVIECRKLNLEIDGQNVERQYYSLVDIDAIEEMKNKKNDGTTRSKTGSDQYLQHIMEQAIEIDADKGSETILVNIKPLPISYQIAGYVADSSGRVFSAFPTREIDAGEAYAESYDFSRLPFGDYLLTLSGDGYRKTAKFSKGSR